MRYTLGIDTSSSDMLASVVIDGKTIASNVSPMRLKVPIATTPGEFQGFSHNHLDHISKVVEQAVQDAGITYEQLDAICVTRGPGLGSALDVGINFAKGLAISIDKPLFGIHHLEGHIYSVRLAQPFQEISFPALIFIASGGITEYILMRGYGDYEVVGGTTDDTVGETIEKIGKVLGFTYPAGPLMEQSAQIGNSGAYNFPRSVRGGEGHLSFNSLKLAVLNEITVGSVSSPSQKMAPLEKRQLRADISINDVAASVQSAICEILSKKTGLVAQRFGVREILMVGGVAANQSIRNILSKQSVIPVRFPPTHLCINNGAMIAAAGYAYLDTGTSDSFEIDALTLWPLDELRTAN